MGAGVFGLSVAWALTQRGARVQVIDPYGVGAGSSGGLVGALAPHVPENWNDKKAFQLDSLLMAADWWADVARAGGSDPGYARTGRLQPVADEHAIALARDRALGAEALWRGAAQWRLIPQDEAGAWAPPSPSGWLIHDTLTARMHPRQAGRALAAALRGLGGDMALILTGAATSDLHDTAPEAVRAAGGGVARFGMPVDPGNLLFHGTLGARPVIGLPGCARSPALNGADWVLERLACGVPVTDDDIAAMGVGGLLKEIPIRPAPREGRRQS